MSSEAQRAPTLFGRFRLSDLGWARRAALIAAAFVGSAAFAYAANIAGRNALREVVRACVLDKQTTGAPLPCLEVALDGGYAVLRPPIGEPDTILTPTHAISGLEDPQLQAPDAPNYFALALNARRWLDPRPADDRVALAVNSRLARSQDQLHVHIGCLSPDFGDRLRRSGLGPEAQAWFRGPDMAPGLEFWSYRSGTKDLATLAPFQLAKRLVGDEKSLRRTTLAVAWVDDEYVVLALRSRPGGWYAVAEDVIDARC